jgi:hypothetical protein
MIERLNTPETLYRVGVAATMTAAFFVLSASMEAMMNPPSPPPAKPWRAGRLWQVKMTQ